MTRKLIGPHGCLQWDLSAVAAGTGPVAVRWPDQKLVRPEGVTHHSPAAASLGPAPTTYSLVKERCPCWQNSFDVVIGVDTHKHTHTAAAVTATGAVLEHVTVPADPKGYRTAHRLRATPRRGVCGRSKAPAASVPA